MLAYVDLVGASNLGALHHDGQSAGSQKVHHSQCRATAFLNPLTNFSMKLQEKLSPLWPYPRVRVEAAQKAVVLRNKKRDRNIEIKVSDTVR